MSSAAEIEKQFSKLGALFLTPAAEIGARLRGIRALVFDWDGVFNSGAKGDGLASTFTEADSMGTNLLRYGLWREHGELPLCVIVTGARNPSARQFAIREHFSAVYSGVLDKAAALEEFCARHEVEKRQVACVFDDVNDLPLALGCGLRFLVRRDASPLLRDLAVREGYCDYMTGMRGGEFAVREVAELALGLLGVFEAVVQSRVSFDAEYASYFAARQDAETKIVDQGPR